MENTVRTHLFRRKKKGNRAAKIISIIIFFAVKDIFATLKYYKNGFRSIARDCNTFANNRNILHFYSATKEKTFTTKEIA